MNKPFVSLSWEFVPIFPGVPPIFGIFGRPGRTSLKVGWPEALLPLTTSEPG
jgi:hypothetical protein